MSSTALGAGKTIILISDTHEKFYYEKLKEVREQAASLAAGIDQLPHDYDTSQYNDTVKDRKAQVANITEDIKNGNTEYRNDFLNALILESVRERIADIFGKCLAIDDSEGVRTERKARELLDKMAEYKALAKSEELEKLLTIKT